MAKAETAAEVVDKKSDVRGDFDERFRKEYVIQVLRTEDANYLDDEGGFHASNKQNVLEQALYRGLRPKGDVVLESAEVVHEAAVGNSRSVKLVYAVNCVPASIDYDPSSTVTAVDNEDTKREHARLAKLRARSDPEGFDAA